MKAKGYVEIVAECSRHGRFQVQKPLNKRPDNGSGRVNDGRYAAVKCPKCPWWATIVEQRLVVSDVPAPCDETSLF